MMKLNKIIPVEKKEGSFTQGIGYNSLSDIDVGYNQGQEDYGNKSVGLDVEKMAMVIKKLNHPAYKCIAKEKLNEFFIDIAQALKAKQDEIIVEVE